MKRMGIEVRFVTPDMTDENIHALFLTIKPGWYLEEASQIPHLMC